MLPPLRQRVLLALAVLIGGACLWPLGDGDAVSDAGPWLLAGEGAVLLLLAVPAAALGVVAAAAGHPASGLFIVSCSLLMPAMVGGPIDPFLYRLDTPAAYARLAIEALLYGVLLTAYALATRAARARLRERLPASLRSDHLGPDDPWGVAPGPVAINLAIAGLAGGSLGFVLLRSSYTGQVTGGLLASFVLAALAAQALAPRQSLLGVVLAPIAVAIAAYAWAAASFASAEDLLDAWFAGELWGLALARPVDYAAAGVTGGVIGFGLGQALAKAHADARAPAAA